MLLLMFCAMALSHGYLCHAWLLGDRACFKTMLPEYQCYSIKSPYTNTLLHYPLSPTKQNIVFKLFTKNNPTTAQILKAQDKSSVTASNVDIGGKVAFVIHGFSSSTEEDWVTHLVKELLQKVPNVIAVDWRKGAKGPNYFQAAANTRVVGAQIATLIKTLGVDPANVHLIGHSLGAHVAGYAGEKFLSKKIARITGLDPAAPQFQSYNNRVKLDPSDATFVDVIHTDAEPLLKGGLGFLKRLGHVDFYPNGGHDMPGCNPDAVVLSNFFAIKDITKDISCSHLLAQEYFIASINDKEFLAYPCASLADYRKERCTSCGSGCNHMGYNATTSPSGMFVLDTGAKYPF
ncbi:pancreatic lipase-related protein 2-like [Littorina saxatilis]|uniref:Lipase domain-containing protein n=1 Tax=Littorina saxatilis TaxID=31220 RepID=A0AAN9C1J7_9CAEN